MSQASSQAISGNVNYGDPSPKWITWAIIGAAVVAAIWLLNRKK